MEDSKFDVIIFGTGLTESIVAAALSKWGFRVAHIDRNAYYGGDEASLTLDEFSDWLDSHTGQTTTRFSNASRSASLPSFARQYSICLCPTIIPSIGPFIDALIYSGVSKYSGFRLLERVAVFDGSGGFTNVPGNKEDVFKNKEISLIQKRRLMRFLTFAVGDFEQSSELEGNRDTPFPQFLESVFSLSKELVTVITYALAYSTHPTDSTISVLPRIRRYLRSVGRYGPSPFLVGHYGGVGEISQGFCRAAAVNGAVYILGRRITSISTSSSMQLSDNQSDTADSPTSRYTVCLEGIPEPLNANVVLGSTSYMPDHLSNSIQHTYNSGTSNMIYGAVSIARCVAVIEHPVTIPSSSQEEEEEEEEEEEDTDDGVGEGETLQGPSQPDKTLDTCVLVFPPNTLEGGSVDSSAVALMTGEGTLSTPKGKYILYIGLPLYSDTGVDAAQILRPYLDVIFKLGRDEPQKPLFTAFYTESLRDSLPSTEDVSHPGGQTWLIPPLVPLGPLGDVADAAARNSETAFHAILRMLGDTEDRYQKDNAQSEGIWPKVAAADDDDET